MPKQNFVRIKLPFEKPDRCADCPLCGIIPVEQRQYNSKETHVCLGTFEALTRRGINIKASKNRRLHRPCDSLWHSWLELPFQKYPISSEYYNKYRIPFQMTQQMVIKFHNR